MSRVAEGFSALGGFVLGVLGTWACFAVAVIVMYGVVGDHGPTASDYVVGIGALLLLPVVAVLTAVRRTATWGVLGFAIGTIVGSGVCATNVMRGMG